MPYIVLDPTVAQAAPSVTFGPPEAAGLHPAGKSLVSMRNRLKLELGNRQDIPDPIWNEWINDAYQDFYASLDLVEARFSFALTMAAGQAMYLIPAQVAGIKSISGTDPTLTDTGGALEKIDLQTYRRLPIRTGTPESWFREKDILIFWPTPDKAYGLAVDVDGIPLPLVADTDYPILQDQWHEVLYKAAKYRAWEGVQNDTKSALVMNEMSRLAQRKLDQDAADQDTEFPTLRPIRRRSELMALRRRQTNIEPGE